MFVRHLFEVMSCCTLLLLCLTVNAVLTQKLTGSSYSSLTVSSQSHYTALIDFQMVKKVSACG